MVTVKVTPEELKGLAGEMTSEVESIKACFRSIDQEVNGTKRYWRGDASGRHISKYQEMKPDVERVLEKLEYAPKDLLKIAGLYEEVEDVNSQVAASLPVDVFV